MSTYFQPQLSARARWQRLDLSGLCFRCRHRFYSQNVVKENDVVLLRRIGARNRDALPTLTKPLRDSRKVRTDYGSIDGSAIIGKSIRDTVFTHRQIDYRIHQPTLAEYVTLSQRLVTPIYPADANLIVSLLDLHPSDIVEGGGRLEIFEAGTGHGALTLHLARAIHGANPPAPPIPPVPESLSGSGPSSQIKSEISSPADSSVDSTSQQLDEQTKNYQKWLASRRAVIHTLDISERYSRHAQQVVRNFRHGLYYPHVDFHVGTIEDYITRRMEEEFEPFLDHAFLDLPSCHLYLEILSKVLKANGSLIVFCPSITQINSCVHLVHDQKLPFALETVLELGSGAGVGGKEWDVRLVKPRALLKAEAEAKKRVVGELSGEEGHPSSDESEEPDVTDLNQDSALICRPRVGLRIAGGGFLGLWRRIVKSP